MIVERRTTALCAAFLVVSALAVRAQEYAGAVMMGPNIEFMSGPIAFDSEPVVGAPYSAEAVTEIVQRLADGNRIVRESKAQLIRDGRGRTRREQSLAMFGPLVNGPASGDEMRHVHITDPATRTTIMLDLHTKTAHKIPAPHFTMMNKIHAAQDGQNVEAGHFEMAVPAPPPGGPNVNAGVIFSARKMIANGPDAKPVVEDLGKQFMEGVTVEGTKTTMTIAAGAIGNELPIHIVSERWFSPELKVLVMSRQSDPRFGETTYRLTNISRAEPSPDLFEVPADFKIFDPANAGHRELIRDVIIERKMNNK